MLFRSVGVEAVEILVVVGVSAAVRIDAVVPGVGGPRVDRGVRVVTVRAARAAGIAVEITIVVVPVTVLVDTVVPDLGRAGVHRRVGVVTVGAGVVAVPVGVDDAVRAVAVLVDSIVRGIVLAGVDRRVGVVTVVPTVGVGVVPVPVLVVVGIPAAVGVDRKSTRLNSVTRSSRMPSSA